MPILVAIRLGSHRGESGDGVVVGTLVLIAPILVVFLWFILVRRSVTIGFGGVCLILLYARIWGRISLVLRMVFTIWVS